MGDSGRCKHLHGHTAKVVINIRKDALEETGMVCHFDELKDLAGKWIADNLDHSMLLSKHDPLAKLLKESGERVFVMDGNPTAENIAELIFKNLKQKGLDLFSVQVWESDTARAEYTA